MTDAQPDFSRRRINNKQLKWMDDVFVGEDRVALGVEYATRNKLGYTILGNACVVHRPPTDDELAAYKTETAKK